MIGIATVEADADIPGAGRERSLLMSRSNFVSRDGAGYELQMGRWSQRLASPFVDFAGAGSGERVLDMGCGTGSLSAELARRIVGGSVFGLDYALPYVEFAQAGGGERCRFVVGDGTALPFGSGVFDRSLSQLVLHFVPDPAAAISELRRVTRPGGVVAATVWDAGGGVMIDDPNGLRVLR